MNGRRRSQDDFEAEIRAHVALEEERLITEGMPRDQARAAARRAFGNELAAAERFYDTRRGLWWDNLLRDLISAFRALRRSPGFTTVALVTLALGIGANSAIFSVVNTILLRPMRFPDASALLVLRSSDLQSHSQNPLSTREFLAFRDRLQTFQDIGAYSGGGANLSSGNQAIYVRTAVITSGLFEALGVRPMLGRTFLPEEDHTGRDQVAIISFTLWRNQFSSDPNLVGKTITVDGRSSMVVGIMPRDFEFPIFARRAEMWLPVDFDSIFRDKFEASRFLRAVGRPRPGVSIDQSRADLQSVAAGLRNQFETPNMSGDVVQLRESLVGKTRPALLVLLGAVGLILLIACANIASLLLSRAASRQREIAVKAALGASRGRIFREALVESLVLALAGGLLGLALAYAGTRVMVAAAPADIPLINQVDVDLRVLLFTLLASIVTGLLFGLLPAFNSSRLNLTSALKEGGRGSQGSAGSRLRGLLVVSEIALAVVVLTGGGLLLRSFLRLTRVETGFRTDHLLIMETGLPEATYPEPGAITAFYKEALQRLSSLPGVESAGSAICFPLGIQNDWQQTFAIEGQEQAAEPELADIVPVGGAYFQTLGIELERGRYFNDLDTRESRGVAIVDRTFAERFFHDREPIGAQIAPAGPPLVIVGVVDNVKQEGLEAPVMPAIYLLYDQMPAELLNSLGRGMAYALHTKIDPVALAPAAQAEIHAIDSQEPVTGVESMEDAISRSLGERRFNVLLIGIFAAVAMVLSAIGIYGVVSYSAARRTQEIGIRMALGANRGDVLALVGRQGAALTALGVVLGLGGALAATRLMSDLLYGTAATDAVTFMAVPVVIAASSMLASYLPARRACRVDPMASLRYE